MKEEKKVTCPFCGAEIDPDATKCPSCGNEWSDAEEREVIRAIMKIPGMGEKRTKKLFEEGFERIKEADEDDLQAILKKAGIPLKIADRVKDRLETKTSLHLCPECGAFVPADADVCPICGADLSAGEEEIESEAESATQLKDDLFLDDEPKLYVCKVCGAFIKEEYEACPICGAPMPENRADMSVSAEDKLEDEERNIKAIQGFFGVQDLNRLENVDTDILESVSELDICSNCGAFVRPEALECPICGAPLVPEIDEKEEEKVTDEALMELEALKDELIGANIEDTENEEHICPLCGSPVPAGVSRCPVCGVSFAEDKEEKSTDVHEEEHHQELILSLDDVLKEEAVEQNNSEIFDEMEAQTPHQENAEEAEEEAEAEEEEKINEEIKEEVNFILSPIPLYQRNTSDEKSDEFAEKEELARALEGGLEDDEISHPASSKEVSASALSYSEPVSEISKRTWSRYEDITMAASAIGAALMASEYLLTNGMVPNPIIAYGVASISILLPLFIVGSILLFLDRNAIFGNLWMASLIPSIIIFPLILVGKWFLPFNIEQSVFIDIFYLLLYFIVLVALWRMVGERMDYFYVWFLGMFQILLHSVIFVWAPHPWISQSNPVPSYALAITGGAMLSLGIYLRIDEVVRYLLSTRDVIMGHRSYLSGDYEDAMRYYSRALDRKRPSDPGYDLAYYGKGTALLTTGNPLEALKYLNRAVKSNPNNEMAWNNRGIALSKLGLEDGALKSYEKALSLNPAYEVAWNNKGNALARMGRYRDALECYNRAIELNPGYRDAWINKGYVLIKLDRYSEAKECAEHVLTPNRKTKIPPGIVEADLQ